MPCACGGSGVQTTANRAEEIEYVVTSPSGTKEIVKGEHAARVAATMSGGSYKAR